jgi:uncharacterized PurR-regulated membrane protein YhhQ (DUF165 family)
MIGALILFAEALAACALLLGAHSLRHRTGQGLFFGLLGGLAVIMAWVTDAGLRAQTGSVTFMTGSTVFYTTLLVGVFVVYVFDGPRPARNAILIVATLSALSPLLATLLHRQQFWMQAGTITSIPVASLRVNSASVMATLLDMVFLGVAWEFLGKPHLKIPLWLRSFLTLLAVMWLDVVLFSTAAFFGTDLWPSVMQGALLNRLLVALTIFPLLYFYIQWQNSIPGVSIEKRPVLAVLREVSEVSSRLAEAEQEIVRRRAAEAERDRLIDELRASISEIRTLRGFIPICIHCKKIRDDQGYWNRLEEYISSRSDAEFTHGICPDCIKEVYPEFDEAETQPDQGSGAATKTQADGVSIN